MEFINGFNKIMDEQSMMAIATSVDNNPNVRVVNFCYDAERKGVVYFTTFKDNQKEKEFAKNNTVAFTTVPVSGNEHVRVAMANVQKSEATIYDLKDAFVKKISDYEEVVEMAGSQLVVYEVHFKNALVTLDMNQTGNITL